jgi:RNA polymerase sigma-70 factor, ECF subfamily
MGRPQLKESPSQITAGLVHRAKKGDEKAFAELMSQTKLSLFRFLIYLGCDRDWAQDICQESYLYAFENIRVLKNEAAFPKWIFLIAKNKFLDHKRSPRNQPYADVETIDTFPELSPDTKELHFQTQQVFKQMDEEERMPLLRVDLEGHSYAEAAEIIGISEAALVSRLHRARQAFQKLFNKS